MRISRSSGLVWILMLCAALLGACSGDDDNSPTEPLPTIDSIAIETITPAAGTALRKGQEVTFTAFVRYTVGTAATGRMSMVIQNQANQTIPPPGGQANANLIRGGGTVTLTNRVTIPATGTTTVRVITPLFVGGAPTTTITSSVSYPVVD